VDAVIKALTKELDASKLLTGEAVKERYHHIWRMDVPLTAKAVVIPTTTEELSATLKICHAHDQPVVVHGGLTNLVGSTETNIEEVVISMEKFNTIQELDEKSRTMTVGAGVILENIQQAAKDVGLLFPLNFGAKGSAQIGGAISTNAGGLRVLRFGMTRQLVLGLEAVLADGTVISSLRKIIKDNAAYDVKQLFIGSEGTLGVITKAVLRLVEAPKSRCSAFIGINDYENVIKLLKFMDKGLAGTLSGFELIWDTTYETMTSPPAQAKPPLPHGYKYYVLVESLGSNQMQDQKALEGLLEYALRHEMIADAAIAYTYSDLEWFWKIREDVHILASQANHDQHFDISLPIPLIGDFIEETRTKLLAIPDVEKVFSFGHVADGNIHFIIGKKVQTEELIHQINEVIYKPLTAINGSISAEHGIGLHKKNYLHLSRSENEIALMRSLKVALDPKGILNRGKVF